MTFTCGESVPVEICYSFSRETTFDSFCDDLEDAFYDCGDPVILWPDDQGAGASFMPDEEYITSIDFTPDADMSEDDIRKMLKTVEAAAMNDGIKLQSLKLIFDGEELTAE